MKARGKKLLAAMLSLAMVLSMFVVPVSAAPGDVTYPEWTFINDGNAQGMNYTTLSFEGLTIEGDVTKHSDQYGLTANGATFTATVPGPCTVTVTVGATWLVWMEEDAVHKDRQSCYDNTNDSNTELVFNYTGEAGTVKIHTSSDTKSSYVLSIKTSAPAGGGEDPTPSTTVKEGSYDFTGTDNPNYNADGLTWTDIAYINSANDDGHGPRGNSGGKLTVSIEENKYTTLTLTTCTYGNGGAVTVNGGETLSGETSSEGGNGKIYTIPNATGETVIAFSGKVHVHSLTVGAFTDAPVVLEPSLSLDAESILVKMGQTATVTATVENDGGKTFAITPAASDGEATVAATVGNGGAITITPKAVGKTKVTVTATPDGGGAALTAKFSVRVLPAQVGTVKEGEYKFGIKSPNGNTSMDNAENDFYAQGLEWSGLKSGNQHGVSSKGTLTVHVPEGETAKLTLTTCVHGSAAPTVTGGTLAAEAKDTDEEGGHGKIYVITDATGDVAINFSSTVYLHSLLVEFAVVQEDRKIDVWDFGAKAEDGADYNNITPAAWVSAGAVTGGKFATGNTVFGDLTLTADANDRLYSNVDDAAFKGILGSYAGASYANSFTDGYTAAGAYYCNGTGTDSKRCATIAHVVAGDKIVAYLGTNNSADAEFHFKGAEQDDTATRNGKGGTEPCAFVAQADGTYKLYQGGGAGKPLFYRIVRFPGVNVSGSINLGEFTGTGYTLEFINQTTGQKTAATVDKAAKTYTVTLAPGFTYTASLAGAPGWGITNATKKVETTDAESLTGKTGVNLAVEKRTLYTYSGSIAGFDDGYDLSGLGITLIPDQEAVANGSEKVELTLDTTAKTFTADLEPNVTYTLEMTGANDYAITAPAEVKLTANATGETITVEAKALFSVSGKFVVLDPDDQYAPLYPNSTYAALTETVTALSFENVDDGSAYTATVADGGYTAKLRAGAYEAVATVSDTSYTTISHVVVADKAVTKDILFAAPADASPLTWVKDVYVGYPDKENNYATVNAAVAAVARMGISSEAKRVTIHIAPGTYREQVIINTPYITLTNDKAGEVLLTWYYGIGYKYYSAGVPSNKNGYYDPERAFDKFEKSIADRWGTTVRVNASATGFRAEGITFENSFNRYVTDEEIADGVEPALIPAASPIKLERNKELDVTSKAATERAAAICVEADQSEFFNCSFLSSQDTLYTAATSYFKNCFIEGETDYIFGEGGSAVFDECTLNWKGYSEKLQAGYITAFKPNGGSKGYLFRDCTVAADSDLMVAPGYLGRPWGANAMVTFLNTKLEKADLIIPAGWTDMSGNLPKNANFHEFGTTTLDGAAVDTSKRVEGTVMTEAEANAVTTESYFNGWTPYYYGIETRTVTFQVDTGASVTDLAADGKAAALNSRNQLVALKEAVVTFKIGVADGYTLTGVTGATGDDQHVYTVTADTVVINATRNQSSSGGGDMVPTGSSGGKTTTVTNPDGSKTTTKTDRKGNTTVTTVATDGSKVEAVTTKAGDKTITVTDDKGNVQAKVELPAAIPAPEKAFTDVPEGHWAEKAVNNMAGLGTVKGVSDGVFDMNSPITRGSVATILYRLSNVEAKGDNAFTDVDSGDWYAEAVTWAVSTGVVTGYSETLFGPKDSIDRQQFAVMLYRYAQLLKLDTAAQAELKQFQDAANVADWASEAMVWCVDKGILKGNGYGGLNPAGTATRAECAVMLDRFIGLL